MNKSKNIKLLLLMIGCLIQTQTIAQQSLGMNGIGQTNMQNVQQDSVPQTQLKTRHLFGIELVGAGMIGSINYSYFRDNILYQIGLGVTPEVILFKDHYSWLIPIQIQFQNPKECECSMINYDVGFWGRVDLSNHDSEVYGQHHAVGVSFKFKNRIKNKKDWIVQFGIYPYFDIQRHKSFITFGLQIAK